MSALRAVFVDTGAWVALRYGRDQYHARARASLRRLKADGVGMVTTECAWELFVRYRDRRVGWVDCASFAVMDELGLERFFGFDEDFVRAGFRGYR